MIHLKIILYGILAFIERNPKFCVIMLLIGIFAPIVFEVVGRIILGIIAVMLIAMAVAMYRMRRLQQNMEQQFRQTTNSATGGSYGGFGGMNGGMSLEDFVRQMQAQADARKAGNTNGAQSNTTQSKKSDRSGDYVDFEEVK